MKKILIDVGLNTMYLIGIIIMHHPETYSFGQWLLISAALTFIRAIDYAVQSNLNKP